MENLIGVGLYTPAEAGRLLTIAPGKLARWLRGHQVGEHEYAPLWKSQIDLDNGHVYLGFRDLMEARIADKFMRCGVSSRRVRAAIQIAREIIGDERPLSTDRFRTDGRDIFLRVAETDEHGEEREGLLNLFRRQYEFKQIIEPLLKSVDFDDKGAPFQWWPAGRRTSVVVDPGRSFGQPIDVSTSVPTAVLAVAANRDGVETAALAFDVPETSVRRAVEFEAELERRLAA